MQLLLFQDTAYRTHDGAQQEYIVIVEDKHGEDEAMREAARVSYRLVAGIVFESDSGTLSGWPLDRALRPS